MDEGDSTFWMHRHRRGLHHGAMTELVAVRVTYLIQYVQDFPFARILDGVEDKLRVWPRDGRRDKLMEHVLIPNDGFFVRRSLPRRVYFGFFPFRGVEFDEHGDFCEDASGAGEPARVKIFDKDEATVRVIDAVFLKQTSGGTFA